MINTYRKKPVVIQAACWHGGIAEAHRIVDWITENGGDAMFVGGKLTIKTLEGRMEVSRNDYVIRGVAGEFYPCKPEIFDATYEHTYTESKEEL